MNDKLNYIDNLVKTNLKDFKLSPRYSWRKFKINNYPKGLFTEIITSISKSISLILFFIILSTTVVYFTMPVHIKNNYLKPENKTKIDIAIQKQPKDTLVIATSVKK